ncbi:unnamed protein product, partial [marine sediment metagenome]
MPKLTGTERVFKAVRRQEPDMVPTFEMDIHIGVIQAIKPGLDYVGFCDYMDLDAVVYLDQKSLKWEMLDEAKGVARSEWGNISRFSGAGQFIPVLREPVIKSESDLDNYVHADIDAVLNVAQRIIPCNLAHPLHHIGIPYHIFEEFDLSSQVHGKDTERVQYNSNNCSLALESLYP